MFFNRPFTILFIHYYIFFYSFVARGTQCHQRLRNFLCVKEHSLRRPHSGTARQIDRALLATGHHRPLATDCWPLVIAMDCWPPLHGPLAPTVGRCPLATNRWPLATYFLPRASSAGHWPPTPCRVPALLATDHLHLATCLLCRPLTTYSLPRASSAGQWTPTAAQHISEHWPNEIESTSTISCELLMQSCKCKGVGAEVLV